MKEKKIIQLKGRKPSITAVSYKSLIFMCMNSKDLITGEYIIGTVEQETEQIIKNIEMLLVEAGSSLKHILKATIYLSDLKYFSAVNEVVSKYLNKDELSRSVFVVNLPRDLKIEIDVMAYIPEE